MYFAAAAYVLVSVGVSTVDAAIGTALGLAPIALYFLLAKGWVRAIAVVGGGLLVLGSSSEVSGTKIIYAVLVVFCAAISAYRLAADPPLWSIQFKPLVWIGAILVLVLAVGVLASPASTTLQTTARQAIFYILIPAAPLIGLDAGRSLRPQSVYSIIGIVGAVSAVGFAADWLTRRGVANFEGGRFVLSSLLLPAFAFGLALVMLALSRSINARVLWLAVAVIIPVAMLVTGTRTNLIVFLAALGVVGYRQNFRVPLGRLLVIGVAVVAIGVVIFQPVANAVLSRPEFIQQRIASLLTVVSGNAAGDASFSGRALQYQQSLDLIAESPFFGYGLGYEFAFTSDTPLSTVMKLGIVGTITLMAFLTVCVLLIRRSGRSPAHTAMWGFILVFAGNLPFGSPFEDRAFGFVLVLIFMSVGAELASNRSRAPSLTGPSTMTPKSGPRSTDAGLAARPS
jgi:O-antigen ligase